MLQLFYIVWGVLCFYSFYFLFFRRWADLISEEDWRGQQTLVDPLYETPTESTISIFPPSLWHQAFHLWFSKGRETLRNRPSRQPLCFCQTSQAQHPHLPIREKTAATMVLSQRQRDELWVPGCKYVGVRGHERCKHEQTCRNGRKASVQFLSC